MIAQFLISRRCGVPADVHGSRPHLPADQRPANGGARSAALREQTARVGRSHHSASPSTTASTRSSTKPMARPCAAARIQAPAQLLKATRSRTTKVMMKQVVATSAISWPMDATCRTSRLAVACAGSVLQLWCEAQRNTHLHHRRATGRRALGAQDQARAALRPARAPGRPHRQCLAAGELAVAPRARRTG